MIPVTKPFLPPLEEYTSLIKQIWLSEHITNAGPMVKKLELKLEKFLKAQNCFFVSNGTIALQIAIKALDLKGEIITTPFSYVATTSSIVWEGCTPIFVDIEADTLTIDPTQIEASISDKTSAILVTHVYGNPCDIEYIEQIAKKYNLKVIYDAAHCFGVEYKDIPVVNYGDISTLSFHATKLFQTVEGGAIVCQSQEVAKKISYLRNFGHDGPENFVSVGINGKNSEFHAAMGLCNLPYIENIISRRKELSELYDEFLVNTNTITRPTIRPDTKYNYGYYPILLQNEAALLRGQGALNKENIFPRRYFYPSLNTLNYVQPKATPISSDASSRALCLPLYHSLDREDVKKISAIILKNL